jgi:5-methylcytosine-specific restriction protein A
VNRFKALVIWNLFSISDRLHSGEAEDIMTTMDKFREELRAQISRAANQGRPHVEINAGELHRIVSPDANRHPMVCNAMRQLLGPSDEVIHAPPAGDGASLTIRYILPRA